MTSPASHSFSLQSADTNGDDLYVADGAKARILRYGADGSFRGAFGALGPPPEGFRQPWDVAWFDGRLYVADMGNQRIARFDPDAVPWSHP